MWCAATLSSIFGLLLGVMAVVSAGSMAVPIFTGDRLRDAMMLASICVPVLQIALVVVATIREDAHPTMAIKFYAVAAVLLVFLLAMPALADLTR